MVLQRALDFNIHLLSIEVCLTYVQACVDVSGWCLHSWDSQSRRSQPSHLVETGISSQKTLFLTLSLAGT